jgi:hypothetical protein
MAQSPDCRTALLSLFSNQAIDSVGSIGSMNRHRAVMETC